MIAGRDRDAMRAVHLCGERVIARLESIGVCRLSDLRNRDPWELMHEVNLEAGRTIWRAPMAILALENLIDAAERETIAPSARRSDGQAARA